MEIMFLLNLLDISDIWIENECIGEEDEAQQNYRYNGQVEAQTETGPTRHTTPPARGHAHPANRGNKINPENPKK